MTTMTVREMRLLAPSTLATNDRGNGCGGPGFVPEISEGEHESDADIVTTVTRDEDPEAWELALDAQRTVTNDPNETISCVAVGEPRNTGETIDSNPHQMIYAY